MSVIIRLQGLPWSASALDIRHFFKGLTIPAGGVHIIGGDRGDAFIAFSSDEDARQGMMRNMSAINGTTVQLYLSSKSEMQSVIEEARSAESGVAAVGGGVAAAGPMGMQQQTAVPGGMQQGAVQQGMGHGFQGHQGLIGSQGMGNQRFPQQGGVQMGRDMNQGQFAGGQNFMGQGNNQMQGHQMPGQQGRDNQFGLPGDRNQGMNQQNFQAGQQHPNQGGLNNQQSLLGDRNLGNADNRGPQSHADVGSYGYGMDGGYGGNDFNQWQNSGPMQGQGQDFRGNQQFYGGDDSSQGQFPNQQRGQRPNQFGPNATGRDGQVPPNQVPFSGQGGEAMPKSDNFGFNQQGGFGQEGMQPNADSTGRFPMRGGRPGPQDVNRGGLLPHPVMPGQTDDLTGGRMPDPQGQIPSRPGPGSRGTPDALVRPPVPGRPDPQPLMDQWPSMLKGQEQED